MSLITISRLVQATIRVNDSTACVIGTDCTRALQVPLCDLDTDSSLLVGAAGAGSKHRLGCVIVPGRSRNVFR
jgi:hypothetical protein